MYIRTGVSYGLPNDLAALNALGFDFQENQVIAILDTYLLAQDCRWENSD